MSESEIDFSREIGPPSTETQTEKGNPIQNRGGFWERARSFFRRPESGTTLEEIRYEPQRPSSTETSPPTRFYEEEHPEPERKRDRTTVQIANVFTGEHDAAVFRFPREKGNEVLPPDTDNHPEDAYIIPFGEPRNSLLPRKDIYGNDAPPINQAKFFPQNEVRLTREDVGNTSVYALKVHREGNISQFQRGDKDVEDFMKSKDQTTIPLQRGEPVRLLTNDGKTSLQVRLLPGERNGAERLELAGPDR